VKKSRNAPTRGARVTALDRAGAKVLSVNLDQHYRAVERRFPVGDRNDYAQLVAPNGNYPNCAINEYGGDTDGSYGNFGMSSFHPGGANALFCDGSVRFLKSSTNQVVIWQLGSRAQGEVISSDAF